MALYFYFNETTGDLVYSDQATYDAEGYTALGEQTDMNPIVASDWIYDSKRSSIKTVTKDPAISGKIAGLTSMNYMFQSCSSLASLDLSGFDTSRITTIYGAFANCPALKALDLSGFDTSQVTNMSNTFTGCNSLMSLDLSGFDTSKVAHIDNMFYGCSLDTVRCRPKQFLKPGFVIPSSSGAWYDYKGDEVIDFSSDAATSLYSDPSKAPDGSKLVNLQDLKAALEAMDGGLPFTDDTVIAESGGESVWAYTADIGNGTSGFVGHIEQEGAQMFAALSCMNLMFEGLMLSDTGSKRMGVGIGFAAGSPTIAFMDGGPTAGLRYQDGMPVLSAMGESGPVMAGDHPYGFATYATDEDFRDYVFREE